MDRRTAQKDLDRLLHCYLTSASPAEADAALSHLLQEADRCIVTPTLREKMGVSLCPIGQDGIHPPFGGYPARYWSREQEDADDLRQEVMLSLTDCLRAVRDRTEPAVPQFHRYAEVTTERAFAAYLRAKYPQRSSLSTRLLYLLDRQHGFARWRGEDGKWLCGFAAWQAQAGRYPTGRERLQTLRDRHESFVHSVLSDEAPRDLELPDLVEAVFNWVRGPVLVNELISTVADLQGIQELRPAERPAAGQEEEDRDPVQEQVFHPDPPLQDQAYRKQYLLQLWKEIGELPPPQPAACLLDWRKHGAVIDLLRCIGIASLRDIARVVGMPAERFAELWPGLPLEDAAIGRLLGLSVQEVINRRKSARERLERRMRAAGFCEF